jgi:tetracycline resistance efflux pump
MNEPGIESLLPPFLAIFLAIRTRQVYLSLLAGIFSAYVLLNGWNLFSAFIATIEALVKVFEDSGNTRTIFFCVLVGGLLAAIHHNGGVNGFVQFMQKKTGDGQGRIQRVKLEMAAYLTGLILFIETSISSLTVGAVFKPLFDKNGISREKLALLADTSSAPSSILLPINAWGAFILSLLIVNGLNQPFGYLLASLPFNFYPLVLLPLMIYLILSNKHFGPINKALPVAYESPPESASENGDKAIFLILPIAAMVVSLPLWMIWDGWPAAEGFNLLDKLMSAAGKASGTKAVLLAVVVSLLTTAIQSIFKFRKWRNGFTSTVLKGTVDLLPLAILMILAFAIGQACRDMNTGIFLSGVVKSWIPAAVMPIMIFLISSIVAFATGTSWGTFAIMMSISIPLAQSSGLHLPLVIAAVLSGGVFGDHCSPISDTTIISSMASGSDHIAHVRTQMPYALLAGSISILLFLIAGFFTLP